MRRKRKPKMKKFPPEPLRKELMVRYPDIRSYNNRKYNSMRRISENCGISKRTMARIFNKNTEISVNTVDKVCTKGLDIHPVDVYGDEWLEL